MRKYITKWLQGILEKSLLNSIEQNSFILNYIEDENAYKYLKKIFKNKNKKTEFTLQLIKSINKLRKIDNNRNKDYYIRI